MLIESPVNWANSRIKADIDRVANRTAREHRSSKDMGKEERKGNFTALNTARRAKFEISGPSSSNSPMEKEELFVPERKKIVEQNKLAFMKTT